MSKITDQILKNLPCFFGLSLPAASEAISLLWGANQLNLHKLNLHKRLDYFPPRFTEIASYLAMTKTRCHCVHEGRRLGASLTGCLALAQAKQSLERYAAKLFTLESRRRFYRSRNPLFAPKNEIASYLAMTNFFSFLLSSFFFLQPFDLRPSTFDLPS